MGHIPRVYRTFGLVTLLVMLVSAVVGGLRGDSVLRYTWYGLRYMLFLSVLAILWWLGRALFLVLWRRWMAEGVGPDDR